jgi:hypothetical protein
MNYIPAKEADFVAWSENLIAVSTARKTDYDRTPSPHPAPDSVPDVEGETPFPRTVWIQFRGINAPRWENGTVKKGPWSEKIPPQRGCEGRDVLATSFWVTKARI